MQSKFLFVCLLVGTFLTMSACKNNDNIGQENETAIVEKLFPVNKTNDPVLKTIMQQAITQNNSKHFAAGFVSRNGYINWAQAEKIGSPEGTAIIAPFAFDNSHTTNGLLVGLLKPNQPITLKFLYRQQLKTQHSGSLQSLLDYFDHKQFNGNKINYVSAQQVPQRLKEKFSGENILEQIKPTYRIVQNNATSRTECITYVQIIDYCYVPSGENCDCDENSQYYQYSLTESYQFCYTTFDEWLAPQDWNTGYGGGGGSWDAQSQLAYELNTILLPEDSYTFQNVNSNNPLSFYAVGDVNNYLTDREMNTTLNAVPSGVQSNGNDTTVTVRVNRSLAGGEEIHVVLKKNPTTNKFSLDSVRSSEYGVTLGWDYTQESFSSSTYGDEITIDVFGFEKYFFVLKNFGTVYKRKLHFRVKINLLSGAIMSYQKM